MRSVTADSSGIFLKSFLPMLLCLLVLGIFAYFVIPANVDLSAGRFALFMDERISFDGVRVILHADGFQPFSRAIVNGDQRYGRSLWSSMAAFSFLPAQIWGDTGQIIAGRMFQFLLIVSVCCIWIFGILHNWYLRLVLTVAVLAMPYSDYYMSMPKPEPLQLFFLSVFCYFYFKEKFKFGWYWFFIGLAFGTKISTLPVVGILGFSALLISLRDRADYDLVRAIEISILSFFLGLASAVPLLWGPVLLGTASYYLLALFRRRLGLGLVSQCVIIFFALLEIGFLSRNILKIWIDNTFLNTTQGADQASINLGSWIHYFFEKWLIVPAAVGIFFFTLVFLFVCVSTILFVRTKVISSNNIVALSIAVSGIMLNLAIFVGVHRLWGFYLYPGTILMMSGLLMMVDLSLCRWSENGSLDGNKWLSFSGVFIAFYLFCMAVFSWAPVTINNLKWLAHRTKSSEYVKQIDTYQYVIAFLEKLHKEEKKTLQVMFTPGLFPPESNAKYQIIEFWGPYIQWDASPDVIVFSSSHTNAGITPSLDSPEYNSFLRERQGYAMHVTKDGASCQATPCFTRKLLLPIGGEILVLKK